MKKLKESLLLFAFGSLAYCLIEILWRRYTHWTMGVTGGVCFVILYRIYTFFKHLVLWKKCIIGSCIITTIEFIVGCIVNLQLKWDVWDYSAHPFNLLGQICPLFTVLWFFLCIPVVYLCKFINEKIMVASKIAG